MKIDHARSEPFFLFYRTQEAIGRHMRVLVAALADLRERGENNKAAGSFTDLSTDGDPWGNIGWKDPSRPIAAARQFVAQMGIVRLVTALEDFCLGTKSEYDRYAGFQGISVKPIKNKNDEEGFSPRKLYYATGWNTDVIERHYPVYDYFSKVRNCIAHRSGRASNDLVSSASSLPLERCLATWHGSAKKTLPDLPALKVDEDVAVLPRHVILAKEACQRIAKDTNAKLVQFLGVDGMVFLAAYHSLLSDRRLDLGARNDPEAMLNAVLDRHRIEIEGPAEGIKKLRSLRIWKTYKQRFEAFQASSESR